MSPRAASRLEALGFEQVYDYVAGKADWGSFGLPLEGAAPSATRVGAHAREVPTCGTGERLQAVRRRVEQRGSDTCFVTDARGVVLGRLGRQALARGDDVPVEEAMTPGPSTVRPSLRLGEAVERMRRQGLSTLPVTRSDGVLIGAIHRDDAERLLRR